MLTGLRRQVEEVGPQGQPGRLVGEVGTKNLDGSTVQQRDCCGEVLIDDDFDDVKIRGSCSSEQAAAAAISRAQMRPGFAEEPDCFTIDICTVDEDSWTGGFVTIPVVSD